MKGTSTGYSLEYICGCWTVYLETPFQRFFIGASMYKDKAIKLGEIAFKEDHEV